MKPFFINKPPHPYDRNPHWQTDGACRGHNPNLFFPPRGTPPRKINEAKQICNECPIRIKCLEYALYHGEKLGIWGGLSERERRTIRYGKQN
jgi:WhiB family redox-sensing transcriptional regulator